MPAELKRFYGKGHLHFITFSCYRRLPLLKTAPARDVFVKELSKIRDEMRFRLAGYVVMPEHVHLLISELFDITLAKRPKCMLGGLPFVVFTKGGFPFALVGVNQE
jgi:putative transposase